MILTGALLLLAMLAAPVAAQVPADRPTGTGDNRAPTGLAPDASVASLAPFAGRRVAAIDLTGHNVTKDWVITREIRTKVGEPLDLEAVGRDVARLDNLSIFAEIRVDGEPVGDDGVRLVFNFKEMPSWFPILSYVYTEENGFSCGPGRLGRQPHRAGPLGLGPRLLRRPRAAVDPHLLALDQRQPPVLRLLRRALHAAGHAARLRGDELRVHARGRPRGSATTAGPAPSSRYFRMKSDTAGITLSPDNEDNLLRLGASFGWDTRDSWRNPRRGWQNEIELWRTGGFLGGDGDWWSLNLDLRRWLPVTRRTKLMLSGLVSLQSGTLGEDLPVYLNYFMGGANSIRGYGVRTSATALSRQEPDAGHGRVLVHRDPAAALGSLEDLAPARGGARRLRRRRHRLERVARPRHAARARRASGAACASWCRARRWCGSTWAGAPTTASTSTSRTGRSRRPSARGSASTF